MSAPTTVAPCAARACAVAEPIPPAAPVIRATCEVKLTSQRVTTVDVQALSGDVARLRRGEEADRLGDVGRRPEPPERDAGAGHLLRLLVPLAVGDELAGHPVTE